jgi:glycosyltransferase involved in cell wall biosynthesis
VSVHLSVVMPVYNERFLVEEAIARVLAVDSPLISKLDLIVVDDGSSDGSRDILRRLVEEHAGRFRYLEHASNRGKGAAVRTGVEHARGDVTVVHDADLEYDPDDLEGLMLPFIREKADAVFGSRFLTGRYRRVLYFRHTLGNRLLTFLCDLLTDLNLTDMETCYKAVRTRLLQSIPLRSNDFRIEPELTIKLGQRGARIFEVPISYAGRTYLEGKKIGLKDAVLAVLAMLRYSIVRDLYHHEEHGSRILSSMSGTPRFNQWMADNIRPWVGSRVLEIGAGLGSLTRALGPFDTYTISDVDPQHLDVLGAYASNKPYMDVERVDLLEPDDFYELHGRYDTVVCLNVLEHIDPEDLALQNIRSALMPEGRVILLVPRGPRLFGTLDEVLGHVRRYTRGTLRATLERNGFELEACFDFNRATAPAWWFNGRVLQRRHFGKLQLRLMNLAIPLLRRFDDWLPWAGTSLIAVARPNPGFGHRTTDYST